MLDASDLTRLIKRSALDAVDSSKPTSIVFGKVISTAPLKINVEQRMILGRAQLALTRNVTDYTVNMTVDHSTGSALGSINLTHNHIYLGQTEKDGSDMHCHIYSGNTEDSGYANLSHTHSYSGTKSYRVHNALKTGEEVILIRMQGGQKYIVLDRVA